MWTSGRSHSHARGQAAVPQAETNMTHRAGGVWWALEGGEDEEKGGGGEEREEGGIKGHEKTSSAPDSSASL